MGCQSVKLFLLWTFKFCNKLNLSFIFLSDFEFFGFFCQELSLFNLVIILVSKLDFFISKKQCNNVLCYTYYSLPLQLKELPGCKFCRSRRRNRKKKEEEEDEVEKERAEFNIIFFFFFRMNWITNFHSCFCPTNLRLISD